MKLYIFMFILYFQAALAALAAHTSDPNEAERLRFLASPAGKVCSSMALLHDNDNSLGIFLKKLIPIFRMSILNGLWQVRGAFWKLWLTLVQPSLL